MKIFLFIVGLLIVHSLGKEYGMSSRGADFTSNLIVGFGSFVVILLVHWIVANGINKRRTKFFSQGYWRIFPITLVVLVFSVIYGWLIAK